MAKVFHFPHFLFSAPSHPITGNPGILPLGTDFVVPCLANFRAKLSHQLSQWQRDFPTLPCFSRPPHSKWETLQQQFRRPPSVNGRRNPKHKAGTPWLYSTFAAWLHVLITRRSSVQIRPPQPETEPDLIQSQTRFFFLYRKKSWNYTRE